MSNNDDGLIFKIVGCLFCLLLLILGFASADARAQQWSAAVGIEHISSVRDGRPFNSRPETSVDMVYGGLRYRYGDWKVEGMLSYTLGSLRTIDSCNITQVYSNNVPVQRLEECYPVSREFSGREPRAIFRIEREFKLWTE